MSAASPDASPQLWLNPNTAVKLFAMFTDGEAPRVRTQVKQYVPAKNGLHCGRAQRPRPNMPSLTSSAPVARFSKLFLDALPALRVSGRLRHEDNKVRNCALEALPAHHGTSGGSSGRLSALLPLQAQVKATLYLKHRQSLGAHTALNAKVELHARGQIGGPLSEVEKRVEGRLELSQKLLNLTGAWPWPAARPESALTCTASGARPGNAR